MGLQSQKQLLCGPLNEMEFEQRVVTMRIQPVHSHACRPLGKAIGNKWLYQQVGNSASYEFSEKEALSAMWEQGTLEAIRSVHHIFQKVPTLALTDFVSLGWVWILGAVIECGEHPGRIIFQHPHRGGRGADSEGRV